MLSTGCFAKWPCDSWWPINRDFLTRHTTWPAKVGARSICQRAQRVKLDARRHMQRRSFAIQQVSSSEIAAVSKAHSGWRWYWFCFSGNLRKTKNINFASGFNESPRHQSDNRRRVQKSTARPENSFKFLRIQAKSIRADKERLTQWRRRSKSS